jgi:hypothetical protein
MHGPGASVRDATADRSIAGTRSGIEVVHGGGSVAAFLQSLAAAAPSALASPTQLGLPRTTGAATPARAVRKSPDWESVQRLFAANGGEDQGVGLAGWAASGPAQPVSAEGLDHTHGNPDGGLPYGAVVDDLLRARLG